MARVALGDTSRQKERYRELVLENIAGDAEQPLSLMLRDEVHGTDGWYKIPLGRVKPRQKGTSVTGEHVIVPVLPERYTTVDAHPDEAGRLRPGWLYVFRDGHLWRELEVIEHPVIPGLMRDVNLRWQQGQDRRRATGETDSRLVLPYRIAGAECTVHIAYSEVQWSWAYLCRLGGMDPQNDPRYRRTKNGPSTAPRC